jgi:hypothetical protein
MEVSGQPHTSTALLPGRESLVCIKKEAGCAPEPVWTFWRGEKSLFFLPGFESRIMQFITQSLSHCTEYAVPAPIIVVNFVKCAFYHGAFCRYVLCLSVI